METTLNKLKVAGACAERYKILLTALGKTEADDEPLAISKIIETNGIQDAIWALRTVDRKDKDVILFAADCAEMVLPIYEKVYPNDDRPRKAIQVARDYAFGSIGAAASDAASAASDAASAASAASDAAWAAAWDAASAAASDAAWAASDAASAASAASDAAWDAASDAASAAASDAAWAAASDAASAAAWEKIEKILIKYL